MSFEERGQWLGLELLEHRETTGGHYPKELRHQCGRFINEARQAGVKIRELESWVGLRWPTLHRWAKLGQHHDDEGAPSFLPIQIQRQSPTPRGLSLLTASGHRVEGLDLPTLTSLLRSLS